MAKKGSTSRKSRTMDDIRHAVTDQILSLMEEGDLPPWRKGFTPANVHYAGPVVPHNLHTRKPYSGINFLLTLAKAQDRQFSTNAWATFKQIKEMGGSVNKGEKGTKVLFFGAHLKNKHTGEFLKLDQMSREEIEQVNRADIIRIPFLREYVVFNADQASGLDSVLGIDPEGARRLQVSDDVQAQRDQAVAHAFEAHLKASGLNINYVSQVATAAYNPGSHTIRMAPMEQYDSIPRFLSTLAHEAGHSTMGVLERPAATEGLTPEVRVREELVAELTAAMSLAQMGVSFDAGNTACYIDTWQQRDAMAGDPNLILDASREASKACQYLLTDAFLEQIRAIDAEYGVNQLTFDGDAGLDLTDDPLVDFDLGDSLKVASEMLNNFDIDDTQAIEQVLALASARVDTEQLTTATAQAGDDASNRSDSAPEAVVTSETEFNPAAFIGLVADSVEQVRAIDVFRLLDSAAEVEHTGPEAQHPVQQLAHYLCAHRQDLSDEVAEVMRDELELSFDPGHPPRAEAPAARSDDADVDPLIKQARTQALSDFMNV